MSTAQSARRQVPITDLGKEYEAIKNDLSPVLERILQSGAYVLGREGTQFEQELAAYIGVKEAVGMNSGTDAILLALRALNIGPGDEVIVPSMSFFATVEPVIQLGAVPIFVDIEAASNGMDPRAAAAKITPKTKAMIVVHLYGQPADINALSALAKSRGIALIEDMAQAIGSSVDGRLVGAFGAMACLSFYPTKNLGACGDAGAVMTSSKALAERLRSLRNHGAPVKYIHEEVAYNTRLDEIQAAVLRLKLKHLEEWNEKRRAFAAQYTQELQGLPITLPTEIDGRRHVYHLYSIQSDKRDALKTYLQENGVSTGLHYPVALPLLPALKQMGHTEAQFPVGTTLARQTLSLPLFPMMTREDVRYSAQTVRRFFEQFA